MAKQIEDIILRLKQEGFENLDKIKGSFRELNKVTGFTESEIGKLRKEILNFDTGVGKTTQSLRGQADALKALQVQAGLGSRIYRQLGDDLKALNVAYKEAATGAKQFTDAQLGSQIVGSKQSTFGPQIAALKRDLSSLSVYSQQYTEKLTEIQRRQLNFNAAVGRQNVIAGFETYSQGGKGGGALPELPNTTAGVNQRLIELRERLANVTLAGDTWIATIRQIAKEERVLTKAQEDLNRELANTPLAQAQARLEAARNTGVMPLPGVQGINDPVQRSIERNRRKREREAAARSGALQGPAEASELFRSIGNIANQQVANQVQFMGRSYSEVAASIRQTSAASDGSLNSLRAQRTAWENLRNTLGDNKLALREVDRELSRVDRQLERRSIGGGRLSGMQLAQGAGAALSGGIFGGPEGLIGGLGGLALGGVGGAFAGAAAGAQVGMFRQQLGGVTDYSARIDKLQIALRGILGSQDAYNRALAAAGSVTRDLNIPQEVAIQGMTRLSAAVKGAGGTVSDSAFAFRAVSEAVKATGGNAEQADGALLALTQVFSKGKVSAEELNQIAERLPGTFTLFAKAAGMTGPQLQKALQEGQVGLNDLMKFLQLISTEYGQTALKIAGSSQEAGARLSVAMKNMQLEVGRALQPIGASLQSAFAEFITTITPSVVAALKGIAAAFEFLIENKTASGLATFALQLGAVTLGLIGLKAALEALATIKVLALLTSTASAVKITGDVAATSALSVRGLSAALAAVPGFGWVAAGTAALGLLGAALYDNNKEFKTWVDSFLYIIKTDFESAWKIAVDIVKTNVKIITDTWEAAKNILTNTAGALVTSFDSTFNGIFSGILKRWQSLPEPLRKAMAQGGAQTIGMVLAPGNPVIGRLIGTGIRATQERPPVALADTGRYVPASAQQRFPGQLSILPSPATDEEKKKKAAKDKAERERQAAAAEQQRLANTLLDQQLRAADRVFQHQIELDRQRYELQKRLDDAQAQNRIMRETGAARDIVSNFEDLQRSLREIEERRVRAVQDVRLAKQTQQSAAVRATFEAQGAAALSSGAVSGAMRQGIYRQGSIGPTSTGPHFDIKRVDGTFFNRAALDAYVRVNGKPLSSGVTVPGGRFGAPRAYGSHAGWDYAFPRGAALSLTGGARFTSTRSNTAHGDETAFVTPDGKVYKILHGKFEPAPRTTGAAGPSTSVRMPTGAAAQQNRAIRASGGAVIEGLDVNKAEAQLQLVEDNAAKERATLFEQFTLKATDALRQQNATMRDSNELQTLRNRLTLEGVRPEFVDLEERLLGIRQEQNQAQTTYNQLVKANPDRAAELQSVLAAQNEQYAERARLLRENAEAAEAFNKAMRTRQDERIGLGLREGAEAYVQSIGTMREATAQLAQTGIKGVEDAIFSLVTTGTANFREFAASILKDTARMIIQQLILRSVMQVIGAIGGGGGSAISPLSNFNAGAAQYAPLANAMGNAYAANGIVPFAMGGIVDQPTMFKFADGGAGRLGLMGEAGPEAIMPLRRLPNGRLGVEQAGGGAPVTVNVSVDASGTSVQGNAGQGEQLGRVISQAVQAELVRQQRPGGLLSR
jgi:lambda family phage tail tape measure protein